jgi:hypothetical protein
MPTENANKPKTEGMVRAEERSRLAEILESPLAEARPKTARKFALFTNLPAASILEMLADLPAEEKPRADANAFLTAMRDEGNTGISSALGTAPTGDVKSQRAAELKEAAVRHNATQGYISPASAAAQGVTIRGI